QRRTRGPPQPLEAAVGAGRRPLRSCSFGRPSSGQARNLDSPQPLHPRPALGRCFLVQGCDANTRPFVHRTHELICPADCALTEALASHGRLAKGEVLAGDALDCHASYLSLSRRRCRYSQSTGSAGSYMDLISARLLSHVKASVAPPPSLMRSMTRSPRYAPSSSRARLLMMIVGRISL